MQVIIFPNMFFGFFRFHWLKIPITQMLISPSILISLESISLWSPFLVQFLNEETFVYYVKMSVIRKALMVMQIHVDVIVEYNRISDLFVYMQTLIYITIILYPFRYLIESKNGFCDIYFCPCFVPFTELYNINVYTRALSRVLKIT